MTTVIKSFELEGVTLDDIWARVETSVHDDADGHDYDNQIHHIGDSTIHSSGMRDDNDKDVGMYVAVYAASEQNAVRDFLDFCDQINYDSSKIKSPEIIQYRQSLEFVQRRESILNENVPAFFESHDGDLPHYEQAAPLEKTK